MLFRIFLVFNLLLIYPLAGSSVAGEPDQETQVTRTSAPVTKSLTGQPEAFFPQPNYKFEGVLEGAVVMHSFTLQNRGDAPLQVKEVKTS